MKGLLCALMIGSKCLLWHPESVKKSDIKEYGWGFAACFPEEVCSTSRGWWIEARSGDCAELCELAVKEAFKRKGTQIPYIYWSRTAESVKAHKERLRQQSLNPMQRQHEDLK